MGELDRGSKEKVIAEVLKLLQLCENGQISVANLMLGVMSQIFIWSSYNHKQ